MPYANLADFGGVVDRFGDDFKGLLKAIAGYCKKAADNVDQLEAELNGLQGYAKAAMTVAASAAQRIAGADAANPQDLEEIKRIRDKIRQLGDTAKNEVRACREASAGFTSMAIASFFSGEASEKLAAKAQPFIKMHAQIDYKIEKHEAIAKRILEYETRLNKLVAGSKAKLAQAGQEEAAVLAKARKIIAEFGKTLLSADKQVRLYRQFADGADVVVKERNWTSKTGPGNIIKLDKSIIKLEGSAKAIKGGLKTLRQLDLGGVRAELNAGGSDDFKKAAFALKWEMGQAESKYIRLIQEWSEELPRLEDLQQALKEAEAEAAKAGKKK